MSRYCRDCGMCCTLLRVSELDKEADIKCSHLRNKKCTIYADRPPSCKTYRCGWLQGANVPKPSKAGYIVDASSEADIIVHCGPRITDMGAKWLKRAQENATVIMRHLHTRNIAGPESQVEVILDRVRSKMGGN